MEIRNKSIEIEQRHVILEEMFFAIRKCIKDQAEIKLNITREQFKLLHAISKNKEEVILTDMAAMMEKDKSTILRLIDSLEKKELVKRVLDAKDRRKNYLMVTKRGEEKIEQYEHILKGIIEELQQGLDESELNIFYNVVVHLKNNAKK